MKTWTASRIKALKGHEKIVCLTAADCAMARILDAAGLHLILVGDSLAMTVLGYETTLPVTLEQMLHHTAAVVRGVEHALVVADMPFLSYQASEDEAVFNAGRFLKEAGADAVKIEGGTIRGPLVRRLVENGIPVLGHIGLTPQSVHQLGGYRVQGRQPEAAAALLDAARALSEAGVFGIVLECVPPTLAQTISAEVAVPTIGIGAGAGCDGQVLVTADMLGLSGARTPRFVKRYAELENAIFAAASAYRNEVTDGTFPGPEHGYS